MKMELTLDSFQLEVRTNVRFGKGLVRHFPFLVLEEYQYRRIGLLVDGGLYDHCEWLKEVIRTANAKFEKMILHVYREKFEPSYEYLDRLKKEFVSQDASSLDCIVAIGGGSVLDTAKGIATLLTNDGPSLQFRGFPAGLKPSIPVIAIPSTAGTGSEMTFNAVFIDNNERKKLGINTKNNYPVLAILDPELIAVAPKSVIVSSGVDALVHTLESFVSKKSNYMTRIYSREAFRLIINALPRLVNSPNDQELCARMQLGSSLAILALSNSSSGPAGGLSYYLGSNFSVPHGIAGGVFIGRITSLNHMNGYYGYSELYDLIELNQTPITDDKKRSEFVVSTIKSVLQKIGISPNLTQFGLAKRDLEGFYKFATMNLKAAFDFNPVAISHEQIRQMLAQMLGVT